MLNAVFLGFPVHLTNFEKRKTQSTCMSNQVVIPEEGMSSESIFQHLESFKHKDIDWPSGKFFGYVFWVGGQKRVTEPARELAFRSVGENHAQKLPSCGGSAVG